MVRTLFYVPRMYTKEEIHLFLHQIPDDYDEKREEFWDYVDEKLGGYLGHIEKVYRDMITDSGSKGLEYLATIDEQNYAIIKKLIEGGASLMATEDPLLLEEAKSWVGFMGNQPNPIILDLFRENLKDRNAYVSKRISETLKEGEKGILFLEPSRKVSIPDDFKIITVQPFMPSDYVNSWMSRLKIKKSWTRT